MSKTNNYLAITFAILVLIMLLGAMQNRDLTTEVQFLKAEIAKNNTVLSRKCLMRQGDALIEMSCTVINKEYATTY